MKEITLAPLPYADDALAPTVSAKTISFHYGKHHAGYVKTLNGLIAGTKYEGLSLEGIVAASRDAGDTAIFNNAAQTWNHDFYWRSLAPAGKGGEPSAELLAAINASFGSLDACKVALADAAVKRFGSGWAWLLKKDGKLVVESTSNAETPCGKPGVKPLPKRFTAASASAVLQASSEPKDALIAARSSADGSPPFPAGASDRQ